MNEVPQDCPGYVATIRSSIPAVVLWHSCIPVACKTQMNPRLRQYQQDVALATAKEQKLINSAPYLLLNQSSVRFSGLLTYSHDAEQRVSSLKGEQPSWYWS